MEEERGGSGEMDERETERVFVERRTEEELVEGKGSDGRAMKKGKQDDRSLKKEEKRC